MTNNEQIKPAPDGEVDEAQAAEALVGAIATIEEYRDYLPQGAYIIFADWSQGLFDGSNWSNDPELIRQVGPAILAASIKNKIAKESY